MAAASLRVGVVVAGATVPAWQYRILSQLALGGDAQLVLSARLRDAPVPRPTGGSYRAYQRIDQALFGSSPRSPLAPVDASEILDARPRVELRAIPRPPGFEVADEGLEAVLSHRLDALLQLGGGLLQGGVLGVARLGLWTFAHEERARRGGAPFFSEMAAGARVVEIQLIARTRSGTRVLARSFTSTSPNSIATNRDAAHWRASHLPERALRALADGRDPGCDDAPAVDGRGGEPRARDVVRVVATSAARVARNRLRLRRNDRVWFVALRCRRPTPLPRDPLDGFTPLSCPPDRFHADPMLVCDGGDHHLFFEDADRASGLGAISHRAIGPDGRAGPIHRVLEAETHFSYPFVFAWRGTWFMIPETSARRTIELHRAVDFPLRWELEKVLFHDVAAVDTTVLEDRGRLWMFTALGRSGGSLNDELFLFHADTPTGAWVPHPMNPIVSDVRRARPAGPLFREDGVLYRPGQDCAGDYGAAFSLNRVDALDAQSYRETPVRRIDASWHPGGLCTHSYTRAGRFEAIDNRVWMRR